MLCTLWLKVSPQFLLKNSFITPSSRCWIRYVSVGGLCLTHGRVEEQTRSCQGHCSLAPSEFVSVVLHNQTHYSNTGVYFIKHMYAHMCVHVRNKLQLINPILTNVR